MIHWVVIPELPYWPVVVDVASQKAAGKFETSREAVSAGGIVGAVGRVVRVGWDDPACVKHVGNSLYNEVLVLSCHLRKVCLRCRVDARSVRIIEHVAHAQAMEYSHWITRRKVESRVLLFKIQPALEPQIRRQAARIQAEEFPGLIVAKARRINGKSQ